MTQRGRMVSRHGVRVTRITESLQPTGTAAFMIYFEVPGMMSKLSRVRMPVWTNAGGAVDHVGEPVADFQK